LSTGSAAAGLIDAFDLVRLSGDPCDALDEIAAVEKNYWKFWADR
jgi:hypothetical protein